MDVIVFFPMKMSKSRSIIDMSNGPTKYTVPMELRHELLRIALETDIIAEYRGIDSWRVAAVSAARWLIRCSAECEDMPRTMYSTIRQIATLARRMSSKSYENRTKSGELEIELDSDEEDE